VRRAVLLGILVLITARVGFADTGCLIFSATPDSYTAPAGSTFTVITTYTNCAADTSIFIGGGFGSDESVYISDISFVDPSFFLAPGDSATASFGFYTFDPSAPPGTQVDLNINAEYAVFSGVCSSFDCDFVGGGFAFTSFTATVQEPVPEPSSLLLLSTGALGLLLKARKRWQGRKSS
jgi:hypothetical protein